MEIRLKMESYVEGSCYVTPSGRKSRKTVLRFPNILDMWWLSQRLLIQKMLSEEEILCLLFSCELKLWLLSFAFSHPKYISFQDIFQAHLLKQFIQSSLSFSTAKCIGELDAVTYVNLLVRLNISWIRSRICCILFNEIKKDQNLP